MSGPLAHAGSFASHRRTPSLEREGSPQTHERIEGRDDAPQRRRELRGLVIRQPVTCPAGCAATRPPTLQEAKPKAGSARSQTCAAGADRRRERSPEVDAISSPAGRLVRRSDSSHGAVGHPDENQSGRTSGANDTWARTGRDAAVADRSSRRIRPAPSRWRSRRIRPAESTRPREQTCEGMGTPGAPSARSKTREDLDRPARPRSLGHGSGTPREEGSSANDPATRAADFLRRRSAWTDRPSACQTVSPAATGRVGRTDVRTADNRPSTRRHDGDPRRAKPITRPGRRGTHTASDGFGWNVSGKKRPPHRASSQRIRSSAQHDAKTAGAQPPPEGRLTKARAGGGETSKREQPGGLAAPGSASRTGKR